ncbi:MAG: YggS family pyridoxal phosphate-dependent enzyme [Planctomycetaceae bacterium]
MTALSGQIAENLATIRSRIEHACRRSGRDSSEVTLVCVTKYAELEWIEALLETGISILGENRPQQLSERAAALPKHIEWHLVGQLQRNKVRRTLACTSLIHSVDSLRLLERIGTISTEESGRARVLLQANLTLDHAKNGFSADQLREEWPRIMALKTVEVIGLMTMAAWSDDPQSSRPVFEELRDLAEELGRRRVDQGGKPLTELSMGMSNDFEVAVESGATLLRLGRSLYRGLTPTQTSRR